MKNPIVKNYYEYDIIKNTGKGLKGYGYTLIIYKDNIEYDKMGSFINESMAIQSANDYFLSDYFNISNENNQ